MSLVGEEKASRTCEGPPLTTRVIAVQMFLVGDLVGKVSPRRDAFSLTVEVGLIDRA